MPVRYYVDERVGCIAVRDRTKVGPDTSPGLGHDYAGVVWYRHGKWVEETCKHCGSKLPGRWEVPSELADAAHAECRRLNEAWLPTCEQNKEEVKV